MDGATASTAVRKLSSCRVSPGPERAAVGLRERLDQPVGEVGRVGGDPVAGGGELGLGRRLGLASVRRRSRKARRDPCTARSRRGSRGSAAGSRSSRSTQSMDGSRISRELSPTVRLSSSSSVFSRCTGCTPPTAGVQLVHGQPAAARSPARSSSGRWSAARRRARRPCGRPRPARHAPRPRPRADRGRRRTAPRWWRRAAGQRLQVAHPAPLVPGERPRASLVLDHTWAKRTASGASTATATATAVASRVDPRPGTRRTRTGRAQGHPVLPASPPGWAARPGWSDSRAQYPTFGATVAARVVMRIHESLPGETVTAMGDRPVTPRIYPLAYAGSPSHRRRGVRDATRGTRPVLPYGPAGTASCSPPSSRSSCSPPRRPRLPAAPRPAPPSPRPRRPALRPRPAAGTARSRPAPTSRCAASRRSAKPSASRPAAG